MRLTYLLLLICSFCVYANQIPNRYDQYFIESTKLYLPTGYDWRLLKAQCYQESRLNPSAVSPAGAYGLCQFIQRKANEMIDAHEELTNLWEPDQSIMAAAMYMDWLIGEWYYPRPQMDRIALALASYNAGVGNILEAQNKCGGVLLYAEIMKCLPSVTGHHSKETKEYVSNIIRIWYPSLLFND